MERCAGMLSVRGAKGKQEKVRGEEGHSQPSLISLLLHKFLSLLSDRQSHRGGRGWEGREGRQGEDRGDKTSAGDMGEEKRWGMGCSGGKESEGDTRQWVGNGKGRWKYKKQWKEEVGRSGPEERVRGIQGNTKDL